jgi:hypothetical protein
MGRISKKKLLEALEVYHGNVTKACRAIGCSTQTFYNYKKKDKNFKAEVERINETTIDYVEDKLFELIDGIKIQKGDNDIYLRPPDKSCIMFFLKCRAKHRGYIERQENINRNQHSGEIKVVRTDIEDL